METIVGIDLGTTNSAIATLVEGIPELIEIDGEPTMPSCVGIDPAGNLVVGQTALNQAVSSPDQTILSIKRCMGEDKKIRLGNNEFSPQEISSFILTKLKTNAQDYLKTEIKKAVITVPAYFSDSQRKATQDAGQLAGLEVVQIINEPTAASIAYEANTAKDERILVYDLGGGTFDVSLVVVEDGVVEVKASHGDTHLGGDDFDLQLVQHVVDEFKKEHGIDLDKDTATQRRLKVVLEKAKCELSDNPFVSIKEEFITKDKHLDMEISREKYEEMLKPHLEKTLDCMHQCLTDASILPADINKVMLVGGSTRTPLVHEMLKEAMNIELRSEINPDLIVAMGACIQGGIINGMETNSVLVDITPYTFGTSVVEGFRRDIFVPIINRNTPIPVSKSEVFFSMVENQKCVEVSIYQGEEKYVGDNILIGDFIVEGLSKAPANNPIMLNLELDINGVLKVTAVEKNSGLTKTVVMDTKNTANNFNIDKARANIQPLLLTDKNFSDDTIGAETISIKSSSENMEIINKSNDLKIRAEKLISSSIDEDDKNELMELIEKSAEAIDDEDWKALSGYNESLSDMIFYMED